MYFAKLIIFQHQPVLEGAVVVGTLVVVAVSRQPFKPAAVIAMLS